MSRTNHCPVPCRGKFRGARQVPKGIAGRTLARSGLFQRRAFDLPQPSSKGRFRPVTVIPGATHCRWFYKHRSNPATKVRIGDRHRFAVQFTHKLVSGDRHAPPLQRRDAWANEQRLAVNCRWFSGNSYLRSKSGMSLTTHFRPFRRSTADAPCGSSATAPIAAIQITGMRSDALCPSPRDSGPAWLVFQGG